ncbi:hypothetical protein NDU88_007950 [Pleurodeles waltl]|uniref:Uncharacterized protein n=1 Tax=Pleurodeles waltl TaxID=8319 RepID=A0AAV7U3W6_PLEWA|nr:hypothetical protein NDU88_007950 [Pleurodeles waltl]
MRTEDESHVGLLMARFFLLPTWRRLGWADWESAVPYNWKTPRFYKEEEKFIKEFGLVAPARPSGLRRSSNARSVRGLNRYKPCPRGCTADETFYHLFSEGAYAQDLLKALSTELGAWIPTSCITADSVMYSLLPGSHALRDLQGCWRLLCCFKDILLFSRNRLVVGEEVDIDPGLPEDDPKPLA